MAATKVWKDRKRILGLPLSFTRYSMSEDRLFLTTGFLNMKEEEVLLYRVRDISSSRSLFQRMLGVGTVTVNSSDKTTPVLVLKNIRRSEDVKEMLHGQVEEMKRKHRVRVSEVSGFDHDDDGVDDLDDPDNDTID